MVRPTPPMDLVSVHIAIGSEEIAGENVWARPLGGNLFQVANVPFFARDVGIHDVVMALEMDRRLEVVDVVERRTVASFSYELRPGVDEPVFFAEVKGTGAMTERLTRSVFATGLLHQDGADTFEELVRPHCRWFERFDATGELVREYGDLAA